MSKPSISRRSFLKGTAGAGAALALAPTRKAVNKLIPYVNPPTETRPGVWSLFATTCRECPAGCGLQIRHIDGRAIKAEGNPEHPVNHGALCARGQSCVQGLYDPDRLSQVFCREHGKPPIRTTWSAALQAVAERIRDSKGHVALLSDLQTGALSEVMQQFLRAFDSDRLLFYEPFNYEALTTAHQALFGQSLVPDYRLEHCEFILSLSADFLETWLSPVQLAHSFAASHSYTDGHMGHLTYVGPRLSATAANADEFLQVPPGTERYLALGMLKFIVERGWGRQDVDPLAPLVRSIDLDAVTTATGVPPARIESLARAFVDAADSVALAGPTGAAGQAATETALAAAWLNHVAGRDGQSVDFGRPHALGQTATRAALATFLAGLTEQDTLVIHAANPVFSVPGAAEALRRAGMVVYLGTMMDETAECATWCLPVDSPLEAWGDYEPCHGVVGLQQPTMTRLHDTRHAGDVLLTIARETGRALTRAGEATPLVDFEHWLRARWADLGRLQAPNTADETFWVESLRRGGTWTSAGTATRPALRPSAEWPALAPIASPMVSPDKVQLWLWPSVMLHDGRVANRGWLQEAPDPTTTLVWDTWVDLHPRKAGQLNLAEGQVVELETPLGKLEAPVRITPDVTSTVAAIAFGQGHTALGRNAAGRGANPFALSVPPVSEGLFGTARIRRSNRTPTALNATCATQDQHLRRIVQWADVAEVRKMQPGEGDALILPLPEGYDPRRDLTPPHAYPHHRWAMVIDLDRCTGCGACAVACYAENNLAVVGAEQVRRGREMAWLRIVPYRDDSDARRLGFIPLLCQQCDAAPCESVCPVFASVHNDEGLNAQVYNRCIGTRYCSHNCPYKVRRFNWLDPRWPKPLDRQLNPDVTVRCRGVMEKCNFCIQRIREIEQLAKREGRPVRDGEVKPACVQTCPTGALVFGDLLNAEARVTALTRRDPRRYHVLEELNTKPAISYLRRVKAQG